MLQSAQCVRECHATGSRPTWQTHARRCQRGPLCRNPLQRLAPVKLPALLVAAKQWCLATPSSLQDTVRSSFCQHDCELFLVRLPTAAEQGSSACN